ncbi:MAG: 2-hydroxyacyl-CoA dehydratase [Deltaproteobacteria bacterium]|nr:2-hydroxyacyl-CoA dehydratase [Deltaproteobacteria bacterium]
MTTFETFQKYVNERWNYALVAEDWKERGGKVIGYPDINCPEELIMAAGCRPLLMTGDPDSGTETAQKHLDLAASFPIRHLYEAILTGRYDFIDVICTTGGDRWLANTYGYFAAEKELNPSLKIGEIYYIERLKGTFREHRNYNLDRLVEFKVYLEKYTGKKITDEVLIEAFMVTNETKRLLKQLSDLRKTDPPIISGCEALTIIIASMLIPKAEYNRLLKQFLEEVNTLPKKDASKVRLFLSGSNVDNLQLYEILESLPAIIVGEDTAFGDRYAETYINTEIDPMEALADRYTYKPLDPWMYGRNDRIQYKVKAAVSSKAQGEIFFHLMHDDAVGWDYPDQRKGLEKQGIPVLVFEEQHYRISNRNELMDKAKAFLGGIGQVA